MLSCSVEDRACQGMVTLTCKSLRGVGALRRAPLFQVLVANTLCFIILSMFCLNLHIVGVKTTGVYLSTHGKPLLCYLTSHGLGISGFSLSNLSPSSSAFFIPSGGAQVFSSSTQRFHLTKYQSSFSGLFLPPTFCMSEMISFLTILSISHSKSPSMSSGSRGGCSRAGLFEDG